MPGDSGVLVVTRVRFTNTKCTRGRGCSGHPAFPTPSKGRKLKQRLGRSASRGRSRIRNSTSLRANGSRECAPDDRLREAIHLSLRGEMDCFVASLLAMTALRLNCRWLFENWNRELAQAAVRPISPGERVGVRGSGLSIVRNPSPGSHLTMRRSRSFASASFSKNGRLRRPMLSHKGRGDTEHLRYVIARSDLSTAVRRAKSQ